jgi:hypothetical protein
MAINKYKRPHTKMAARRGTLCSYHKGQSKLPHFQCDECGCEYEQPARYPYRFCAARNAPFAAEDEIIVELPWFVS